MIAAIEALEGIWSFHAAEEKDRLDLRWPDVVAVARTADTLKRERDATAVDRYKYAATGRDPRGRRLTMAGKVVTYEEEATWKIITIHEGE